MFRYQENLFIVPKEALGTRSNHLLLKRTAIASLILCHQSSRKFMVREGVYRLADLATMTAMTLIVMDEVMDVFHYSMIDQIAIGQINRDMFASGQLVQGFFQRQEIGEQGRTDQFYDNVIIRFGHGEMNFKQIRPPDAPQYMDEYFDDDTDRDADQ